MVRAALAIGGDFVRRVACVWETGPDDTVKIERKLLKFGRRIFIALGQKNRGSNKQDEKLEKKLEGWVVKM